MTAAPETPPSSPPSGIDHVNVIGGSGFIGTRLCERFARDGGPAFTIVDKVASRRFPEYSVIRDIRDAAALADGLVAGAPIIHLAAEHRDDVRPLSLYHDVNVTGTANVCRAATAHRHDPVHEQRGGVWDGAGAHR
jgi:nucleoside-diphosphate-sugar epimerase